MKLSVFLVPVLILLSAGCGSIGPNKVTRDRVDYSHSLADSWKEQMLLNIIKVRYLDLPIFLDVGQLVTSYSLESSVNLGGTLTSAGGIGTLGAQGRYTDRPTITYMPMTGEKFLAGFLTPIPPLNVFALVQSGYEADFILELCLDSFNGLFNRPSSIASRRQPDPEFFHVLSLMREVQDAGAFGMRLEQPEGRDYAIVFFFRDHNVSEEIKAKAAEVRRLLDVETKQMQFELVYSPMHGGPGKLGVGTRSLLQMLQALSLGISIPEAHRQLELIPPMMEISENENALLRVHSGPNKPDNGFVAVPYEDQWFWIAQDDWKSKNTFSSILFLFTLSDSGGKENLPTITIPTY
jgi:hypothetical protein